MEAMNGRSLISALLASFLAAFLAPSLPAAEEDPTDVEILDEVPREVPPGMVYLEWLTTGEPLQYWVRTQRRVGQQVAGEKDVRWKTSDTLEIVELDMVELDLDSYEVTTKALGREDVKAQRSLDHKGLPLQAYKAYRSGRRHPQSRSVPGLLAGFFPAFPEEPIGPKHRWKTRTDRTPDTPIPLEMRHTLVGLEKMDGWEIFLIESEGSRKGKKAKSGIRFRTKAEHALALSVEGLLVKAVLQSETRLAYPARKGKPARKVIRQLHRIVEIRIADQIPQDDKPDAGNPFENPEAWGAQASPPSAPLDGGDAR